MVQKIQEKFANAKTAVRDTTVNLYLAAKFTPTSAASKFAKAFVLAGVLMFATAQPVLAEEFIAEAVGWLGWLIIAIGGGLGAWGIVNLVEGYGNDNPGAKSQGMKQLMAGGALIIIGAVAPDALAGLLEGG